VLALRIFAWVVVAFMMVPVAISLPVALTSGNRIAFPPDGVSLRWFASIFADAVLLGSVARSFWLATLAAAAAVLLALPCALALERARFRGRVALETLITGPRMIPQIVLVLGLLIWFERIGLAETFLGLVLAHLVVSVPFAFRTLMVSVAALDRRLENASATLGASRARTFVKVTLPQLKTGVIAAAIFTFILSFNNVTLALFLSALGQRTLPVEMFQRMYVGGMTPVIPAIAFLLALGGAIFFVLLDRTIGVFKHLAGRD
jgi:putative spermidine/putrescine transport system permease protein